MIFDVVHVRSSLVLTLLLLPALRVIVFAAGWRPDRAGHCAKCSYDLTANVSGVCPECGMAIAEAK